MGKCLSTACFEGRHGDCAAEMAAETWGAVCLDECHFKKRTVWKFPIGVADTQTISVPEGAVVLCVQVQDDQPCIWALVDPGATRKERHFKVVGTGHPITDTRAYSYIGTFQLAGGRFIGHLFEIHPES